MSSTSASAVDSVWTNWQCHGGLRTPSSSTHIAESDHDLLTLTHSPLGVDPIRAKGERLAPERRVRSSCMAAYAAAIVGSRQR